MRARMHLTLIGPDGVRVAERRARNSVMRSGAELVGRLFAGGGTGITHMAVGTSDDQPEGFTTTALANSDGAGGLGLVGATEAAIAPAAFTTVTDETRRLVLVRVRATLPPDAAVGKVREAGLVARADGGDAVLYNRVTFAPIGKGDDHELTMFWEVSFPYGDLQWLL